MIDKPDWVLIRGNDTRKECARSSISSFKILLIY
jgi:hypothetical protein